LYRMMRIIGGKARGRNIRFESSSKERPTSDFLRETLFNLLGDVEGKTFVDLFAGSGSVGLEAASRGAREVCFIEKNKKLADLIKKNAALCGLGEIFVLATDIEKGLKNLVGRKYRADVIFADPPYHRGWVLLTLDLLKKYDIARRDSVIVIQHSIKETCGVPSRRYRLLDERKYGDSALTLATWREENGE